MNTDNTTIPQFDTERLLIRGVCLEDASSYEANFATYDVVQFLSNRVPWPYPKGSLRTFLQEVVLPEQGQERWLWVLLPKENPKEVIGAVELWREGKPEHRGFWLTKRYWGQGLMREALIPIMNYAFATLEFSSMVFSNAVQNTRSRGIKEKMGARYLGTKPAQFVDPQCSQTELWEISAQEWFRFQETL